MSLSPTSFTYVAALVRRETAVIYDSGKEYLVEARLLPLAREAGEADVDAYVFRIQRDKIEERKAIDALTINETSWFRDNSPYRAFTEVMLPMLLANRTATCHLNIWSAACSSGQEAYSLAMLLHERLPAGWSAEILATDVSTAMLERVNRGRYGQVEMNRGMPASQLVRYFTRVGSEWEVAPELRAMVRTQHLNLAAPLPPLPTFDVVFLRNVLIYFEMDVKRDIMRRFRDVVAPDGYLLLGSSETALDMNMHWRAESIDRVQVHRPLALTPYAEPARIPATSVLTGA